MKNNFRTELFPEISPYANGMLPLDNLHTMYWEQSGNETGVPVLFLHGGPGAGSSPLIVVSLIPLIIGLLFMINVGQVALLH